jgi:2-keto-4-pentenoate hydratase/2-oxohepta-3-ene-1,7-dioic acid hydratase in catechol pathway
LLVLLALITRPKCKLKNFSQQEVNRVKLVTFERAGAIRPGLLSEKGVLDLAAAAAAKNKSITSVLQIISETGMLKLAGELAAGANADLWRPLADVKLLTPIPNPQRNIFCVGRNYKLHIEEGARARGVPPTYPPVPEYFSKATTTVIGPGADIRLDPSLTKQLDYEVELAIVIGKRCRDLSLAEAMSAVAGYTIVNDISARDLQRAHGQWFKGKGLDTFCPIGPCIVTADEFGNPSGKSISLRVNGATRQDSNTADLLFDCATIVSALSAGLTLLPGDIIATGTPSGVALGMTPQAWLKDGDIVEAEVAGIGVLKNKVFDISKR